LELRLLLGRTAPLQYQNIEEINMKSLRIAALMFAFSAFALSSIPTYAQQEVDPDHYDQPSAASVHSQGSGAQSHHKKMAAQNHNNVKLASKHSHKAHHHQASA